MNERDSESVAAHLLARGYSLAESEGTADVVLLNTCSVRDSAEQKAVGKMRSLAAEIQKRNTKVVLGFMGCMAQAHGQKLLDQLPAVNLVLGTRQYHRTAEHLDDLVAGKERRICDTSAESSAVSAPQGHLSVRDAEHSAVTAFVNIMQGCNQYSRSASCRTRGEKSRAGPSRRSWLK